MATLEDDVIHEGESLGEGLLIDDFVALVERHHPSETPGVERDLVEAYLDALEERRAVDVEWAREALDEQLTDADSFETVGAVYAVGDDRVSAYPEQWHERLAGADSLARYVQVLTDAMDDPQSGASSGISEETLLDAATVIGDADRETARSELRDLRAQGVLVADADQHPDAGLVLADDADFEKNPSDKPDWGDRSSE